ncbi:hypothetical protein Glove_269g49 [Diversispora epigaea]|uniref:TLDc domain-containing protein n=1 Tax=Diversispora epigaea TaxID=1348612 RepID=A0A397IBT5_9GLOM|nr:hypothetical protein Glove_269g49 [Diversispora epigaea]
MKIRLLLAGITRPELCSAGQDHCYMNAVNFGLKFYGNYNVIIEVDKYESKKTFTAHSAVLRYRSPYFNKELANFPQNEDNVKPIYKPDTSNESFDSMLSKPVKSIILPPRKVYIPKLPSRTQKKFSTIIRNEQVAEISSWIDRKDTIYSLNNIPHEFNLILRGSEDKFDPKSFWEKCHDHSNTITILKVANTGEILGGFNPIEWNKPKENWTWIKAKDSFIFSLKNGQVNSGICFGNSELAMKTLVSDFTKDEESWFNINKWYDKYYERSIRTAKNSFSIIDYELFKVVKKST